MDLFAGRATAEVRLVSKAPVSGRWRMLALLALLSLLSYLDRVNISVAAAPISAEFGFTDMQLGAIFSAFVLGYMLFQVPGGWLGDRAGHANALTFAIVWWSVFTALTAWAGSPAVMGIAGLLPGFCIVRFLIGVGEAATYPCGGGLVARWFPPNERAFAAGVMLAGVGIGSAITPPFVAWVMVTLGWRAAFILCSAIGIAVAVGFHQYMARLERRTASGGGSARAARSGRPRSTPWRAIFGHRDVRLLTLSDALHGYIVYVYFYWFYMYLVRVRDFSLLESSVYATLPFLAMSAGAPTGGWASDRLIGRIGSVRARRRIAMSGLITAAVLIPIGATTPNPYVAITCLSLAAGSVYFALSSYWATALEILPSHSGTVSATVNTGANFGGVISPVLTPWMATHYGWNSALFATAALSVIAALLWWFIGRGTEEPRKARLGPN